MQRGSCFFRLAGSCFLANLDAAATIMVALLSAPESSSGSNKKPTGREVSVSSAMALLPFRGLKLRFIFAFIPSSGAYRNVKYSG
jgi:hypothetical protein